MILSLRGVSKHFGGIRALDSCSMDVNAGSITAIIGPNGSGKSTLFSVISGLETAHRGTIFFCVHDITGLAPFEIARLGISRTFQDVRLFRNLTIRDHLQIALSSTDEQLLSSMLYASSAHDDQLRQILGAVRLEKSLDTVATDLSYGQRKLLDLAVAIAKPHSFLMLDEPVAGVNPHLRQTITSVLRTLSKKGETILLIEHDMNFVMDLADTLFVMDEGKVIAHGPPTAIQRNKKVLAVYLGD